MQARVCVCQMVIDRGYKNNFYEKSSDFDHVTLSSPSSELRVWTRCL